MRSICVRELRNAYCLDQQCPRLKPPKNSVTANVRSKHGRRLRFFQHDALHSCKGPRWAAPAHAFKVKRSPNAEAHVFGEASPNTCGFRVLLQAPKRRAAMWAHVPGTHCRTDSALASEKRLLWVRFLSKVGPRRAAPHVFRIRSRWRFSFCFTASFYIWYIFYHAFGWCLQYLTFRINPQKDACVTIKWPFQQAIESENGALPACTGRRRERTTRKHNGYVEKGVAMLLES